MIDEGGLMEYLQKKYSEQDNPFFNGIVVIFPGTGSRLIDFPLCSGWDGTFSVEVEHNMKSGDINVSAKNKFGGFFLTDEKGRDFEVGAVANISNNERVIALMLEDGWTKVDMGGQ